MKFNFLLSISLLLVLYGCNDSEYVKIEDNNSDIPPMNKTLKNIEIPIITANDLNHE
jgi:hypothetical protein